MARRVRWTAAALRDLRSAADYVARDSPRYASFLSRQARDSARSLAELSERGRIVPEFEDPQVRELILHSYRLIYYVADDMIHVMGLIHGARDLRSLWEREGRHPPS
jgi:plasmid stabilization system protein ParE